MLLRSASTGVLSSLVSCGPAPVAGESVLELHTDHLPVGKSSVPSTPTHASASVAAHRIGDDTRSIDGGGESDNGGHGPWPRFRKVQSESDLQSLCRASSGSFSAFAAAESLLAPSESSDVVESFGVMKKSWSKRGRSGSIRRGRSLSVISSGKHMEIDDAISELAESLTPLSSVGHWEELQDLKLEASPTAAFRRGESKASVETKDYIYDESNYMVSSLAQEVATFSGRQQEAVRSSAASMSVAVESSRVGLVYGSQQRAAVAEQLLGTMYVTDVGMGGGGRGGVYKVSGGGGGTEGGAGDTRGAEAHFRRQLQADPENALLLRNYAKFLDEVVKEPHRAEVYYERAILASPGDGEVLGAYAKLIWDVYKDEDRAGRYFEQALEASPDDCYLSAAHAAFLWASEDDEAGGEEQGEEIPSGNRYNDNYLAPPVYGTAAAASA
ncbi:hypothetical protein R1sor_022043 [Riccia sorocarpa]|uniref:TmcB/TmcC TPR repeats domain-containing protein n=1 Tax=Riccia sorocarpa TaxID=122646 RepID=A0ABD3GLQ7_9MARC